MGEVYGKAWKGMKGGEDLLDHRHDVEVETRQQEAHQPRRGGGGGQATHEAVEVDQHRQHAHLFQPNAHRTAGGESRAQHVVEVFTDCPGAA